MTNENEIENLRSFLSKALRAEMEGAPVNPFASWICSEAWTTPSALPAKLEPVSGEVTS